MGRALPNFRELAALEAQEPKMVEMVQRFERERSDQILEAILEAIESSKDFTNLFTEIANLYGPIMFESIFNMGNDRVSDNFFKDGSSQTDSLDGENEEDEEDDFNEDDDDPRQIPPHDSGK